MKKIIKLCNSILFKLRKPKQTTVALKHILIVSNTALGDTILSTPVIKSIRKSFPDVYITFMVNKAFYDLFVGYEYVDKIITYQKGFIGLVKHIKYMRKNKIDSIFFLHSNGPQDLFLALLSNATNIHKALNYPSKVSHEFLSIIKNQVYNTKHQHIIEHRLDTIKYLNPSIIDKTISLPKKICMQYKKDKDAFTIGIQLGAADVYKMWPIENFVELVDQIHKLDKTIQIILLGIKKEQILAHQLVISTQQKTNIINYCGKTEIKDLPCIINSLDLLITNDTGTLHLAVALQKRTVSLFSPTDASIFGPYQDFHLHSVIQKDGNYINIKPKKERNQEAMKLITVDEVYKEIVLQINRIKQCVE